MPPCGIADDCGDGDRVGGDGCSADCEPESNARCGVFAPVGFTGAIVGGSGSSADGCFSTWRQAIIDGEATAVYLAPGTYSEAVPFSFDVPVFGAGIGVTTVTLNTKVTMLSNASLAHFRIVGSEVVSGPDTIEIVLATPGPVSIRDMAFRTAGTAITTSQGNFNPLSVERVIFERSGPSGAALFVPVGIGGRVNVADSTFARAGVDVFSPILLTITTSDVVVNGGSGINMDLAGNGGGLLEVFQSDVSGDPGCGVAVSVENASINIAESDFHDHGFGCNAVSIAADVDEINVTGTQFRGNLIDLEAGRSLEATGVVRWSGGADPCIGILRTNGAIVQHATGACPP